MNAKILFLNQKELRSQLLAIVHSEWFQKSILYAQAELYESEDITTEQMKGVRKFISVLNDLPEDNVTAMEFPSSGLQHHFEKSGTFGKENE